MVGQQPANLFRQAVGFGQIDDADGAASDFVLIGRTDATRVVPIFRAGSGRRILPHGVKITMQCENEAGVFSKLRLSGVTATPCVASRPISASNASGSTTTPLPMTETLPGRTMPEGSSDSL